MQLATHINPQTDFIIAVFFVVLFVYLQRRVRLNQHMEAEINGRRFAEDILKW